MARHSEPLAASPRAQGIAVVVASGGGRPPVRRRRLDEYAVLAQRDVHGHRQVSALHADDRSTVLGLPSLIAVRRQLEQHYRYPLNYPYEGLLLPHTSSTPPLPANCLPASPHRRNACAKSPTTTPRIRIAR